MSMDYRHPRASGGPGAEFPPLAVDARFRGHDGKFWLTYTNFRNEVLGSGQRREISDKLRNPDP